VGLPVPSQRTAETKAPMAQPKISKVLKPKPERIEQQIRTLVELGRSADEIAAFLRVTVGSVQVTCSQLGLDLQKPPEKDAVSLRPDEIGRMEAGEANLLLAVRCNCPFQTRPS
jgi:hypothetical protein